jgi:integrase/recombinase XerD
MKQAKTLTAAELRRVTDSIATRAHAVRNRAMLMMTHLAGLRVGEVAQLAWADVVTAEGTVREEVRLNADQTKGTQNGFKWDGTELSLKSHSQADNPAYK